MSGRVVSWVPRAMQVLPDVVGDEPTVVFCGMAGAAGACTRDHRYETPGNSFWDSLSRSGLLPEDVTLSADDEHRLPEFGLGSTDLVRHQEPLWFETDALLERVGRWQPRWLAFTSKTVAHVVARHVGRPRPGLGPVDWYLGEAQVFVLPGVSGANRRRDYDGLPTRLAWWEILADLSR